jgi:hypothetical protein
MNTLKRGQGMSTYNEWNDPKAEWERWKSYLPNGKETYVGQKSFFGKVFNVFRCMDDSYLAQDEYVCSLEASSDMMKVISVLPEETERDITGPKMKMFRGKNWKLASDKKWEDFSEFYDNTKAEEVGTKEIDGRMFKIYVAFDGFIAFSEPDAT